ncbi:TPA: hypothetical protein MIA67_12845 [Klebsiella pneumoniae]|nr:hypothetical protein [Klebsiella pneumoniae]HBY4057831.1 hypothetical protein [Klebsiella pneumoniae]HBY4704864.1 hypothetical protein [Klebsiella pneumoniae]HBY4769721.1 hypothetical protein [Klebsiella pneumoniae]HBY4780397.1 hypothetical protein [Klebsiella pneumoniae]
MVRKHADTPIPVMEVPFTWQASLELNAKLYSALGQCNLDKAGVRRIEDSRLGNSEPGSM